MSPRVTAVVTVSVGLLLAVLGAWWGMRHARPSEPSVAQQLTETIDAARGTTSGASPIPAASPTPAPAPTGVDPELMSRYQRARDDAEAEGVLLMLTSGWRSAQDQQELVDEVVAASGDPAEAHRRVLPPDVSAHVQGTAIDVGGTEGALWLGERQQEYGLCRTYANEVRHFELVGAVGDPCPEMWPDASHGWD